MAIERLLTRYIWLKFSNEQRLLMRSLFNIPKSGGVVMVGNVMESDGSNEADLKAVNVESMQAFLESDEKDFDLLLSFTVDKIDSLLEDTKQKKIEEAKAHDTHKRIQEIDQVVDTILETINNLPIDAQIKIKVALSQTVEDTEKSYDTETTPIKKSKKASDK